MPAPTPTLLIRDILLLRRAGFNITEIVQRTGRVRKVVGDIVHLRTESAQRVAKSLDELSGPTLSRELARVVAMPPAQAPIKDTTGTAASKQPARPVVVPPNLDAADPIKAALAQVREDRSSRRRRKGR